MCTNEKGNTAVKIANKSNVTTISRERFISMIVLPFQMNALIEDIIDWCMNLFLLNQGELKVLLYLILHYRRHQEINTQFINKTLVGKVIEKYNEATTTNK